MLKTNRGKLVFIIAAFLVIAVVASATTWLVVTDQQVTAATPQIVPTDPATTADPDPVATPTPTPDPAAAPAPAADPDIAAIAAQLADIQAQLDGGGGALEGTVIIKESFYVNNFTHIRAFTENGEETFIMQGMIDVVAGRDNVAVDADGVAWLHHSNGAVIRLEIADIPVFIVSSRSFDELLFDMYDSDIFVNVSTRIDDGRRSVTAFMAETAVLWFQEVTWEAWSGGWNWRHTQTVPVGQQIGFIWSTDNNQIIYNDNLLQRYINSSRDGFISLEGGRRDAVDPVPAADPTAPTTAAAPAAAASTETAGQVETPAPAPAAADSTPAAAPAATGTLSINGTTVELNIDSIRAAVGNRGTVTRGSDSHIVVHPSGGNTVVFNVPEGLRGVVRENHQDVVGERTFGPTNWVEIWP